LNEGNQTNQIDQLDQIDDEINLIDLVYPLYRRRRFLIFFCIIVMAIVGIVSLLIPKTYEAVATILPEAKEGGGAAQLLKTAFLEKFGISMSGDTKKTPVAELLKSEQVGRAVRVRYNFPLMGIGKDFKVIKPQKKALSVTVQANDPIMAADIANTYVMELDKFNRTNTVTSAQRLRKYVEERLKAVNRELEQAQEGLRRFQEENKAISISQQAEATIEVLSQLEAQRVALEVEKAAKGPFYGANHVEIGSLDAQMDAIQKNIDRLTYSEDPRVPVEREKGKVVFYIPLTRIPGLNFDESRHLLKVEIKAGVVTMLNTQLEQARLDEAKDMPTINVLDWAEPPTRPIKPGLKLNIVLGAVVALFVGIFLVFFLEYTQRVGQYPETSPKWQEMRNSLVNSILFFGKFFRKPKE